MSTRGFIGYRLNNKQESPTGWYNQSDSYLRYLGKRISGLINICKENNVSMTEFFTNKIELIGDDPDDEFYKNHTFIREGNSIKEVVNKKDSKLKLQEYSDFFVDRISCEYAYVFNLYDGTISVYKGPDNELTTVPLSEYAEWLDKFLNLLND